MRNIFITFILLIVAYSCITDYDLQQEAIQSRLVVEGTITNQDGPYFIRLTKSRLRLSYNPNDDTNYAQWNDGVEPIYEAKVYITDKNTAVTETLVGSWTFFRGKPYASDSIRYLGQYQTKNLKGIPGHTYTLKVSWQNKEYQAESYMPPVPTLDSVQFNFTNGAIGKPDYNIPLLFFKEPQNERNYYLFHTTGGGRSWPYSILSDEYLKEYVNGLDVCKGVSPDYWMNAYPYVYDGKLFDDYFIEMHSLTKEAYEYYKALLQQFKTDGGGYSPSPASPPTNLDNGALGFFRTSAVNRVDFKAERN